MESAGLQSGPLFTSNIFAFANNALVNALGACVFSCCRWLSGCVCGGTARSKEQSLCSCWVGEARRFVLFRGCSFSPGVCCPASAFLSV